MDSVPNGGWLDGCLNVLAGAEVLRRIADDGPLPVTVRLVDWADEEGARFGRSLFGSSAAAGSMTDQDELRKLVDRDGVSLPDAIGAFDVYLDRALEARSQLETAAAYLELHIEQGPVLESLDMPLGVVLGTFGVERAHHVDGQAAHAGSTPMDQRRDALAGAAKLALAIRDVARETGDGAVCTSGGVTCRPGSSPRSSRRRAAPRPAPPRGHKLAAMLARARGSRVASPRRSGSRWSGSGSGRSSRSSSTRRSRASPRRRSSR